MGSNGPTVPSSRSGKILICAPSNAAIDEVAKRLNDGVYGSQGQRLNPKVVRVGADMSINVSAREISLDALVDKKMDAGDQRNEMGAEMSSLRNEIEETRHARQRKHEELNATANDATKLLALEGEIKALNAKRIALSQRLDQMRDKQKSDARAADAERRRVRLEILAEADVVCSTLSGAGHEQLEPFDFDMIIIDEAAQAIELSSLIPLKYRSTQCIMVGGKWKEMDSKPHFSLSHCRPPTIAAHCTLTRSGEVGIQPVPICPDAERQAKCGSPSQVILHSRHPLP